MNLRSSSTRKRVIGAAGVASTLAWIAAGIGVYASASSSVMAGPASPRFQQSIWFQKYGPEGDARFDDNNPDATAAAARAADQAYPATHVGSDEMAKARGAFDKIDSKGDDRGKSWQLLGPTSVITSAAWTYTGNQFGVSGRITALGIGNVCTLSDCTLYVGAAGGGIWRTRNALATTPSWTAVNDGLLTNAIGSIWVDPNNANHVLVGTGEPNGSGDSEAGVGLYETSSGGGGDDDGWKLLPGSLDAAQGRSIGAVAVDPADSHHIFIGTAVARHGSSAVNGGRFTPPKAPQIGLYESKDGGASFKLVFSQPSDSVNPASANGNDFFRGGVSKIQYDPTTAGRIYLSMFDYGLYRSDGHGGYEQVFASAGGGLVANSIGARTEFALADRGGGNLRIYLGDTDGSNPGGLLYRVDNANVSASTLTSGGANPGWTELSNPTPGTPGYASFGFCEGQCSYDMFIGTPAGHPDTVWIGGSMEYSEFFGPSNGRAVQRSVDAGQSFTDMTNDQLFNGTHPDQHAIVFDPANPDIAFTGSDGGLIRTSGSFGPDAIPCASRGLSGADLTDCNMWLAAVPTQIYDLNGGLSTLQFQSVSVSPVDLNFVMGGTQDNGTIFRQGSNGNWVEKVGGDGGQSGFNVSNANTLFHSYFGPAHDINFHGGDPLQWDWIADPLGFEAASFYVPMIYDPNPATANTLFEGEQHVWRTTDNGGSQAFLETYCNEFNYHPPAGTQCGDWQPIGGAAGDLTAAGPTWGTDKGGSYVVALARAQGNTGTMWVGTRRGRLFVTTNADASDPNAVTYIRIDSPSTPTRFVSGIALDPEDPNHAYVSFSGYDAYAKAAGTATGHVFEVRFKANRGKATWKDISGDIGDQPVTGIAYSNSDGNVYAATDFGVLRRGEENDWSPAASGLPLTAVYGLTLATVAGKTSLYAATHGRGIYVLKLNSD